ncbi:MAG: LysR family transcriptional regulator, partial [Paracoccaceae bacterium]
ALGRSSLVNKDVDAGRLVAPFDLAVAVDEAFYLIAPSDGVVPGDATHFVDWLVDTANAK